MAARRTESKRLLRRRLLAESRCSPVGEGSVERKPPRIRWSSLVLAAVFAQLGDSLPDGALRWTMRSIAVLLGASAVPNLGLALRFVAATILLFVFSVALQCRLPDEASLAVLRTIHEPHATHFDLRGTVQVRPRYPRRGEMSLVVATKILPDHEALIAVTVPDLPWHPLARARVGDDVRFSAKLQLLTVTRADPPPPFGYYARLFRTGIAATAHLSMRAELDARRREDDRSEPMHGMLFSDHLARTIGSSEAIGVLLAGAGGNEELLSRSTEDLFRSTGLTHLLVVSGYHVAVIFSLLRWASMKLAIRFVTVVRAELPASLVALVGTIGYGFAVGMEPTISRALIALGMLVAARLLCRKAPPWRALCVVLLLNLLIFPGSIFEPGSELTFGALLGLAGGTMILAERRLDARALRLSFAEKFVGYVLGNVLAFLGTLPVVLCWFGAFAPSTVLYNLLYGGAFTMLVIVCGGLLLGVEWIAPGSCAVPLRFLAVAVEWMLDSLRWFSGASILQSSADGPLTPLLEGWPRVMAVALTLVLYCAAVLWIWSERRTSLARNSGRGARGPGARAFIQLAGSQEGITSHAPS